MSWIFQRYVRKDIGTYRYKVIFEKLYFKDIQDPRIDSKWSDKADPKPKWSEKSDQDKKNLFLERIRTCTVPVPIPYVSNNRIKDEEFL